MTDALVCGVDSSTQSTKVELRDVATGELVASARAAHPRTTPPRSEQHPHAWWDALVNALGATREHLHRVVALSVAGQQHGLVVVDAADEVLRPAKLWNDTESAPQADALVEALGAASWAERVGSVPVAAFTITKLAWLADREPEVFEQVARVMLPHDWLTFRLTGHHVTDRGDASGTGWWSPAQGANQLDLLALVDPQRDWAAMVPAVLDAGATAGEVSAAVATATGLPVGSRVACGTGDNMAAALGLGLKVGDLVVSLGTSGTAYARSATPTHDAGGFVAGFADATGGFLPLVCTLNATKVTDAFQRVLGVERDRFAALSLAAPAGARGLTLVPYLDGERTPNRPDARGHLGGITGDVTPEDVARAAHEGVVCGLLAGVDALAASEVALDGRMFLVGGGAKSPAYQRVGADLAQRRLRVPHDDEVVATGACVQAAALHLGTSHDEVGARWRLGSGIDVDPDPHVDAAAIRSRYQAATEMV